MSAAAVMLSFLPGTVAAWFGSRMGLPALAFMPGDGQTGAEHEVSEPVHLDHGDWGWGSGNCFSGIVACGESGKDWTGGCGDMCGDTYFSAVYCGRFHSKEALKQRESPIKEGKEHERTESGAD